MINKKKLINRLCSLAVLFSMSFLTAVNGSDVNGSKLDLSGVGFNSQNVNLVGTDNSTTELDRKMKTAIGQWVSKHKAELIFSGVAIGTGITALALNSKVKDLKAEEKALYKEYKDAPKGSDFETLWKNYTDAHDETEKMANVRNGFSLATGGITVAIVMSFYIGRP